VTRALALALIVIAGPALARSTTEIRQMGSEYVCVTRHDDGRVETTTCRKLGRETVCQTR
jgi:hypothetical protein